MFNKTKEIMKVKELIKLLEKQEDQDRHIEVSVGQYNRLYPVAYCEIETPDHGHLQSDGISYRLQIRLPEDEKTYMLTSTRKK